MKYPTLNPTNQASALRSINEPIKFLTPNQSTNQMPHIQSINQVTQCLKHNQPTNESTSRPINQPIECLTLKSTNQSNFGACASPLLLPLMCVFCSSPCVCFKCSLRATQNAKQIWSCCGVRLGSVVAPTPELQKAVKAKQVKQEQALLCSPAEPDHHGQGGVTVLHHIHISV